MKNLVIGLLVIGLTSLGYSQNSKIELAELEREDNNSIALNRGTTATSINKDVAATSLNVSYLNEVKEETMSKHIKSLEDRVSKWDVMESPGFDGRSQSFKVIFKATKGSIIATYDNNGKVLTTLERFKDIKLPRPVIISVLKKYPNWTFWKNSYFVSYHSDKGAQKVYRVQVRKDNMKKSLKIDSDGNII